VAGPNAGHTGYDAKGNSWALRQVPVGAVVDGALVLGIAAGSEVDPDVLIDEVTRLKAAGLLKGKTLWVHGEATLIEPTHHEQESPEGADLHKRIGSTGKGIGAARAARIWRQAKRVIDEPGFVKALEDLGVLVTSSIGVAATAQTTIIEGTQGYGLGLHMGHYPQCTSSDCRAIDFMAMAGVNPWEFDETEVWAVARVYPIRVAGNSGPLKDETSWEALGLPEERTTVTKKVRRVGGEDWNLVRAAVYANGNHPVVRVALTMLDQKFPEMRDRGVNGPLEQDLAERVTAYLTDVQKQIGAEIKMVTTGPNTASWM
jgi:adenylosuccinate synthase